MIFVPVLGGCSRGGYPRGGGGGGGGYRTVSSGGCGRGGYPGGGGGGGEYDTVSSWHVQQQQCSYFSRSNSSLHLYLMSSKVKVLLKVNAEPAVVPNCEKSNHTTRCSISVLTASFVSSGTRCSSFIVFIGWFGSQKIRNLSLDTTKPPTRAAYISNWRSSSCCFSLSCPQSMGVTIFACINS